MCSKNRLKILRFEPCRVLENEWMGVIKSFCPFSHFTMRILPGQYSHCVYLNELDLCIKESIEKYVNLSPVEPQEDQ